MAATEVEVEVALNLGLPDNASVRLARPIYEDYWTMLDELGSSWKAIADAERDFYDSCSDDEWHAYICDRVAMDGSG